LNAFADLDRKVAEIILLGADDQVELDDLAKGSHASPEELREAVDRLGRLGYPLTLYGRSIQREHCSLIDVKQLRTNTSRHRIAQKIEWRLHVDSTQEELRRLGQEVPDGTVLISESQSSGKGRMGRSWFSPLGGIWMSILLKPSWPSAHQVLTLAFAAAVRKAMLDVAGIRAGLKWPNDVIIGSRKVAGILAEAEYDGAKVRWLVVGLGVNANIRPELLPHELRREATSLSQELGHEVERTQLTRRILEFVDRAYTRFESGCVSELVNDAKSACFTIGRMVKVTTMEGTFVGKALDLGVDGQLVVALKDGQKIPVYAADVVHLR